MEFLASLDLMVLLVLLVLMVTRVFQERMEVPELGYAPFVTDTFSNKFFV